MEQWKIRPNEVHFSCFHCAIQAWRARKSPHEPVKKKTVAIQIFIFCLVITLWWILNWDRMLIAMTKLKGASTDIFGGLISWTKLKNDDKSWNYIIQHSNTELRWRPRSCGANQEMTWNSLHWNQMIFMTCSWIQNSEISKFELREFRMWSSHDSHFVNASDD
jgi:hypothetical protein